MTNLDMAVTIATFRGGGGGGVRNSAEKKKLA